MKFSCSKYIMKNRIFDPKIYENDLNLHFLRQNMISLFFCRINSYESLKDHYLLFYCIKMIGFQLKYGKFLLKSDPVFLFFSRKNTRLRFLRDLVRLCLKKFILTNSDFYIWKKNLKTSKYTLKNCLRNTLIT